MRNDLRISFIGGGNMAAALIGGLAGKLVPGPNIHVVDINPEALQYLNSRYRVSTAGKIDTAVSASNAIVLALKPQEMRGMMAELAPYISKQLVLSIAAGIRAIDLSRWLNGHRAIVRTMPNTPALIGQGITGLTAMDGVSQVQMTLADSIMQAAGTTVWLDDESLIDAITALSGSGPGYVFYFIEAMQQAALELGLNAKQARQISIATFTGASQLAAQLNELVSVLRERVTSKGGTTAAALTSLEESGVGPAIINAIKAAAVRSKELGEEFGKD